MGLDSRLVGIEAINCIPNSSTIDDFEIIAHYTETEVLIFQWRNNHDLNDLINERFEPDGNGDTALSKGELDEIISVIEHPDLPCGDEELAKFCAAKKWVNSKSKGVRSIEYRSW